MMWGSLDPTYESRWRCCKILREKPALCFLSQNGDESEENHACEE